MNHYESIFSSRSFRYRWICFLTALVFLSAGIHFAGAGTADDAAKAADQLIRSAESSMFSGKIDAAVKHLEDAMTHIKTLKMADPAHKSLKNLETKYTRIKTQVDKKLGQTKKSNVAPSTAPAAAQKSDGAKLPAGVSKRLRDIGKHLDNADRQVAKDAGQARYVLEQADELFREIDSMYQGQFEKTHADYAAVKNRYDGLTKAADDRAASEEKDKAGARASGEQKEKQSAQWAERFRAYLSYPGQQGHDPDKLVFVPGTSEPEKFDEAKKRYEAFKAFYQTYQATEFPNGKTGELEELADRQAPQRLADFESGFSDRMASISGDIETEIDQAMKQLETDNGWKKDESIKPPIVDAKWMRSLTEGVEKAKTALGSDPKSSAIKDKFAALQDKDKENRKIRTERTLFFPHAYKEPDAKDLEKMVEAIIKKEKPGSKILRISLYKKDWKEETVEGWSDTTKTKWEKRTSRMINAQAAAKDAKGVFLHTIYLARDKQTSGWGPLYGHIMWSELMLERNINKDGKK